MKPTARFLPALRPLLTAFALTAAHTHAADAPAAAPTPAANIPVSWVDPDTGYRVTRLTREPGSDSLYFNVNSITPDGQKMVYSAPGGIFVYDWKTKQTKQVVKAASRAIQVGFKSATLFYTRDSDNPQIRALWRVNLDTGEDQKIADLPRRASVSAINADETLGAGSYIEGDAQAGGAYDGSKGAAGRMSATNMGEPENKGEMMARRLAAKLPSTLFTIDLKTGAQKKLLEHTTDWLGHLQFSPKDPSLLMYCHEGMWEKVDRIWLIRTDGTENRLIHQRTMEMEIAGHEWWSADGQKVYYQLHLPIAGRTSSVASYDLKTGERLWLQYPSDQQSIHHSSSPDDTLYCGDGNPKCPWIFLSQPKYGSDKPTLGKDLIKTGVLQGERLVNMSKHNYRLEPNAFFTPDMKHLVFRSNMFGDDYVFAVETKKGADAP